MSGKPSTKRQYEVLEAIRAYKNEHGFSPSMRNLMGLTGITSTSVVDYYLRLLEAAGLIHRTENISRSIELVGTSGAHKKISLKLKKTDPRKTAPVAMDKEKSAAGRKGRGTNAFVRKHKSIRDPGLQARIEMVVQMAQQGKIGGGVTASGEDVIKHNRTPLLFRSVRATKVG